MRMQPYADENDGWYTRPRPIDVRYVGDPPRIAQEKGAREPHSQVWMRADGTLPDDPLLHVCAVAYASDMTLLDSTLLAHGRAWGTGDVIGASLDHAMWFHRPFRADEWWLYDQESPWTGASRGLARGSIYTAGRPAGRQRGAGGPAAHAPLRSPTPRPRRSVASCAPAGGPSRGRA